MAKSMDENLFAGGPIPGMSLTGKPRNVPWENPPMLVSVEDAIQYYVEKLLDPETEDAILSVFDNKVDVVTVADHLITSSTMNGIHSLDVGFLVNPVVRELLMLVADSADIEYVESYKKQEMDKRLPRHIVRQMVKATMEEQPMEAEPQPAEETMPPEYRGLMAPPPMR